MDALVIVVIVVAVLGLVGLRVVAGAAAPGGWTSAASTPRR